MTILGRRSMQVRTLLAMALLIACPVWAINKCTDADGRITYQDSECPSGKSDEVNITDNGGTGGGYGYGGSSWRSGTVSSGAGGGSQVHGSGVIHTGPRGGKYTVGPSGHKNYLPRSKR